MVSGSYKFTIDELLVAQEHASKERARRSFLVLLKLIGLGGIACAIFCAGTMEIWLRVYIGLVGLYLVLLRRPLARLMTKKHFKKRPDQNIEIRFEISDAGIVWSTADSSSNAGWSLVSKVRQYSDGFLVFSNPKIFNWIPKHALGSSQKAEELAKIFSEHVKDFKTAA